MEISYWFVIRVHFGRFFLFHLLFLFLFLFNPIRLPHLTNNFTLIKFATNLFIINEHIFVKLSLSYESENWTIICCKSSNACELSTTSIADVNRVTIAVWKNYELISSHASPNQIVSRRAIFWIATCLSSVFQCPFNQFSTISRLQCILILKPHCFFPHSEVWQI